MRNGPFLPEWTLVSYTKIQSELKTLHLYSIVLNSISISFLSNFTFHSFPTVFLPWLLGAGQHLHLNHFLSMFSLTSRFQAVANTTLSVSIAVSVLVALISIAQLYFGDAWNIATTSIENVSASATVKHSRSFGAANGKAKENSKIVFDLDADLTPLFNWNTKQVFIYLTAEYDGKTPESSNKVTYWDKIITSPEDAVLHLRNQKSKYSVWDVEKSFRSRNATLKLEWNIQPWVGPLLFGETETASTFQFALSKKPKKS